MKGMARVLAAALLLGAASGDAAAQAVGKDCTFKGRKLYGKVEVVTSSPDIKVQIVTSFPDLKIMNVGSFPDSCGKWQMVTSWPDLKVQFVTSFPDIKVMYVNSFPGVP
jgi:hypothetical protein